MVRFLLEHGASVTAVTKVTVAIVDVTGVISFIVILFHLPLKAVKHLM